MQIISKNQITISVVEDGDDGRSVISTQQQYYLSTSKTTQLGGSWLDECPAWASGKYLWKRLKVTYSEGDPEYSIHPEVDSSWEAINDVQIGVTNIVNNSAEQIVTATATNQYAYNKLLLDREPKTGDKITITADVEVLAGDVEVVQMNFYNFTTPSTKGSATATIVNSRIKATLTMFGNDAEALLLYAGVPGSTAGNSVKFTNIMVTFGNKEVGYLPSLTDQRNADNAIQDEKYGFLLSAISKLDGSTLDAGLALLNVLAMRNEDGDVAAGMNGLDASDVVLWAGGSIEDVDSGAALPVKIKKKGTGSNIGILQVGEESIFAKLGSGGRIVEITTKTVAEAAEGATTSTIYLTKTNSATLGVGSYAIAFNEIDFTQNVAGILNPPPESTGGPAAASNSVYVTCKLVLQVGAQKYVLSTIYNSESNPVGINGSTTKSYQFNETQSATPPDMVVEVASANTLVRLYTEMSIEYGSAGGTTTTNTHSITSAGTLATVSKPFKKTVLASDGLAITLDSSNRFIIREVNGKLTMEFNGDSIDSRTTNSNVIYHPNGIMEQWGYSSAKDEALRTIYLSKPFYTTDYNVQITLDLSTARTDQVFMAGVYSKSTSYFKVRGGNIWHTGVGQWLHPFHWRAIGRWK